MIRLGLVGDDIARSLSPRIHAIAMERAGIVGSYDLYPTGRDGLGMIVSKMRESGTFIGLNVTIPYKEAVIGLLDDLSPEAEAVGAVNTIRKKGKKLAGFNTDYVGFLRALEDAGFDARGRNSLVFGAGGAARALAYGLGRAGAAGVTICARDRGKAECLAAHLSSLGLATSYRAENFDDLLSAVEREPPALVVNATPLGSSRFPGMSPVSRGFSLQAGQLVVDIVYEPETTPLLDESRKRGARTMNGLRMLVHQALESFTIWTGVRLDARHILERL